MTTLHVYHVPSYKLLHLPASITVLEYGDPTGQKDALETILVEGAIEAHTNSNYAYHRALYLVRKQRVTIHEVHFHWGLSEPPQVVRLDEKGRPMQAIAYDPWDLTTEMF